MELNEHMTGCVCAEATPYISGDICVDKCNPNYYENSPLGI
jgi:hypothetical protein